MEDVSAAGSNKRRSRWIRLVYAASLLACGLLPLVVAAQPRGTRVLVLSWPGSSSAAVARVVAAADGRLVSGTRLDWAMIAQGADERFASRLLAAGALLVLDASLFDGCETNSQNGRETR